MPEIKLKLNQETVGVEVLEKYENTYKVQYTDPNDHSINRIWVHETRLIFPQFSELVF